MDIGREAGFSRAEQVDLREASIVLQAHTLSDIVTADGTRIKEGIFEGLLTDRRSNYRWPRPQPWHKSYGAILGKLANYVCIRSSILIKKLGSFVETARSQKFLYKWNPTSDRLIDLRGSTPVEHMKLDERHGRRSRYKLDSEASTAGYPDLSYDDVTVTDTFLLMHGRSEAICRVPPQPPRRRRGHAAIDPINTDYT